MEVLLQVLFYRLQCTHTGKKKSCRNPIWTTERRTKCRGGGTYRLQLHLVLGTRFSTIVHVDNGICLSLFIIYKTTSRVTGSYDATLMWNAY
jgi:hypothetical protein